MVTTFNSKFNNSSLNNNSKNTQEEEKSNLLCNTTLSISLQTNFIHKQDPHSLNEQSLHIINNIEEVKSLQIDAESIHKELLHLELRSILKRCKIDDLRKLIQRLSEEDYYFDRTLDHKRYFNFARSFSCSSSHSKKVNDLVNIRRNALKLKGVHQKMFVVEPYLLNLLKLLILQEQQRKEREKNLIELSKVVLVLLILTIVFFIGVRHSLSQTRRPFLYSYQLLKTPLKELNLLIKKGKVSFPGYFIVIKTSILFLDFSNLFSPCSLVI